MFLFILFNWVSRDISRQSMLSCVIEKMCIAEFSNLVLYIYIA